MTHWMQGKKLRLFALYHLKKIKTSIQKLLFWSKTPEIKSFSGFARFLRYSTRQSVGLGCIQCNKTLLLRNQNQLSNRYFKCCRHATVLRLHNILLSLQNLKMCTPKLKNIMQFYHFTVFFLNGITTLLWLWGYFLRKVFRS